MAVRSGHILTTPREVEDWRGIVANVYADDTIDRGTWQRASRELPSFRHWDYETFANTGLSHMMCDAFAHQRQPDADFLNICAAWATMSAEQGIPVDEAAEVFHLYRMELNQRAAKIVPTATQAPKFIRLSELAAEWLDAGLLAVLRAYRSSGGTHRALTHDDRASQLIRSVLSGGTGSSIRPGEFERFGLNSTRHFFAVRARPTPTNTPAAISRYLCSDGPGLTAYIDGDVCGVVEQLPQTPAPVPVGVGGPVRLSAIGNAFLQASRARETSAAFGLSGLRSLESLGLYPSVLADNEVGDALVARYIEPVARLGASGQTILATVERYLESNCALAETAKLNFLHVNTVRYRLRKFEEITGRSLKSAEMLAEVWWALARRRVMHDRWSVVDETLRPVPATEDLQLRA